MAEFEELWRGTSLVARTMSQQLMVEVQQAAAPFEYDGNEGRGTHGV